MNIAVCEHDHDRIGQFQTAKDARFTTMNNHSECYTYIFNNYIKFDLKTRLVVIKDLQQVN